MIIELGTFELLQKLADRLIELVKDREEKTKNLFDRVIEPIYRDLLSVHQNYMEMFEETLNLLPAFKEGRTSKREKGLQSALRYLESNRLKLEPVRQKLRVVVRHLDSSNKKRGKRDQFIAAAMDYMFWFKSKVGVGSVSMDIVSRIQMAKRSKDPLNADDVRRYVSAVMIAQRERFVHLTEAYGKILAKISK